MDNTWLYLLGSLFFIAVIIFLTVKNFRDMRTHFKGSVDVPETFIKGLIKALGEPSNIIDAVYLSERVTFTLHSVDIVDYELLKTLEIKGIFVSENQIKMILKYDASSVVEEINKLR